MSAAVELAPPRPVAALTTRDAVVAASGAVAAMALAAVVRARPLRRRRRRRRGVEVLGTHSFLIDVHVVRR